MSVLVETTLGDFPIDLYTEKCPKASENFLKLCKKKYYNNALLETIQKDYLTEIKTKENKCIYEQLKGEQFKYFDDEVYKDMKYNKMGLIGTSNLGPNRNQADFFIVLTHRPLQHLDEKHTIFGYIPLEEGEEILDKINQEHTDDNNMPFYNIRIKHTIVIEDPFDDPEGFQEEDESPEEIKESDNGRLEYHEKPTDHTGRTDEEVIKETNKLKAKTEAIALEMINDIADADAAPPENVLFVCQLNQATQESDLELIFSRFGPIKKCDVVRDWKTGQSLQYAFIEFEAQTAAEEAYFKMDNALIDERRIQVNFCQSVEKIWRSYNKRNQQKGKKQYSLGEEFKESQVQQIKLKDKYDQQKRNKHSFVFKDHDGEDKQYRSRDYKKRSYSREKKSKRDRSRDRDDKKKDRSRSRERDNNRDKKRDNRDRSREKDRERDRERRDRNDYRDRKNRSRSRDRDRDHRDKKSRRH